MGIARLFQTFLNYTGLIDNPKGEKMYQCKYCFKMTARKETNTSSHFIIMKCSNCNTTWSISQVVQKRDEIVMGKKKNKKNKNKNKKVTGKMKVSTAVSDSWEVEIDCVDSCSKAPESIPVWILPLAKSKIDALMDEYKNIEWLAYLLGDKEKNEVHDIYIPDQTISSTLVDNVKCDEFNNLPVIGVMHSHHTMGSNFSQTDKDWINQNHDISLCISTNGIKGDVRFKTACGAYKIVEAVARLKIDFDFDTKAFIESVKDKLVEKTYTTVYNYGGYHGGFDGGGRWVNGVWKPGESQTPVNSDVPSTQNFLTKEEVEELESEVEELDFTKELTLAEELTLMEEASQDGLEIE